MKKGPSDIKVLCWDFDLTITNEHMHNWLMSEIKEQRLAKEDYLHHFKEQKLSPYLINDLDKLAETLLSVQSMDIPQAVVSFTNFPAIIEPTLRFVLSTYMLKGLGLFNDLSQATESALDKPLTQQDLEMIAEIDTIVDHVLSNLFVVAGFPTHAGAPKLWPAEGEFDLTIGKKQHLDAVKTRFGIVDNQEVLFVDDDRRNIALAKSLGYQCVMASVSSSKHYEAIKRLLDSQKEPECQEVFLLKQEPALILSASLEQLTLRERALSKSCNFESEKKDLVDSSIRLGSSH